MVPNQLNKFRVMRRKQDGVMFIALPDLLEYFRELREKPPTPGDVRVLMIETIIDQFSRMIYEDLVK
jgi:hypothetical protein